MISPCFCAAHAYTCASMDGTLLSCEHACMRVRMRADTPLGIGMGVGGCQVALGPSKRHKPHTAYRTPQTALRTPQTALRKPHTTHRTPHTAHRRTRMRVHKGAYAQAHWMRRCASAGACCVHVCARACAHVYAQGAGTRYRSATTASAATARSSARRASMAAASSPGQPFEFCALIIVQVLAGAWQLPQPVAQGFLIGLEPQVTSFRFGLEIRASSLLRGHRPEMVGQ